MQIREFGRTGDETIAEIELGNAAGAVAKIISHGAVLRDLVVPKPGGGTQRVVLGLETLEDYRNHSPHFGAIAGRYANRIGQGRFLLDGRAYQLPLNQENRHSLHGGGNGFGKRAWTLLHAEPGAVTLGLVSPDGDANYPGTLAVTCRYLLGTLPAIEAAQNPEAPPRSVLRVELSAFTDAPTIINLCHHSYFNLDGGPDILDHDLMLRAPMMTPVDSDLIPDGAIAPVAGTPFDFRRPRPIRHLNEDGTRFWYDHNFVLRREKREPPLHVVELAHAATLASARSGLAMEVWTTEPCLQFYDGFKLNLPVSGLDGAHYGPNAGLCLEPQHAPDSPNHAHFPTTVLRPGELYRQVTEFRFGPAA
jgi:aldose 1-epimerase